MSTDIDDSIDAALIEMNVRYECRYIGARKRRMLYDDKPWDCDEWEATFYKVGSNFEVPFYTGVGCRKKSKNYALPKPVKPRAASVLYSALLDSRANTLSFNEWCNEYYYNSDSIRTLSTYQLCCESAKLLRSVFTPQQLDTLNSLLEEY